MGKDEDFDKEPREDDYDCGCYLTQSGYFVGNDGSGSDYPWFYLDYDMEQQYCCFDDLVEKLGNSEFPLRECTSIICGADRRFEEPDEEGFYSTRSGNIVGMAVRPGYSHPMWSIYKSPSIDAAESGSWKWLREELCDREFPLRKITKDRLL